ncbi:hypothetical protein [Deinococcus peraridilitoris]|nr:hypothetical protein [Deinococcus peraridilitoris]
MLAKSVRLACGLALAAVCSSAFAQVPTSAAAGAAVEVNSTLSGRVINCPEGLRISAQAVCLFANGTVDALKPRVKAKFGDRVIEDWKTRTGSRNASLLVRSGNDITYILLAQANANSVLAIVDAPAGAAPAQGQAQGGAAASAPATTGAPRVAFASARDLSALVSVQAADTVGTFTRLGQSVVVTANNRSARFGTGSLQLESTPYSSGGQLFVPVTMLRNLGCTVAAPQGTTVSVTCGGKTQSVNVALR